MESLQGRRALVAGGTANIGALITHTLLQRGAMVVVPSRSQERLGELRSYLAQQGSKDHLDRLVTLTADPSDDAEAAVTRQRIVDQTGGVDAVVASVGNFATAPTVLGASTAELQRALDGYILAHHRVARAYLPLVRESGGRYLFVQGPLAFDLYPGLESPLISIATAGQHMLFRALAKELDDSPATVVEMVVYALIRNRETQPGSPVPAETIGPFAADLLFDPRADLHGQSIHLTSPEQHASATTDRRTP